MTPTDANHDKDLEDSFRVWFERTPLPEAPETLHQSLRRAVEERRPSRPQPRWRPLVAATLAGALALVLLIVSGFDERLWNPGPVPNDGGVSTPQVTPGATPLSQASAPPIVSAAGLVDAVHGWAVTKNGLMLTADGGQSWAAVTPSGVSVGDIIGVDFLDPLDGWVIHRKHGAEALALSSTSDAGATWADVDLPTTLPVQRAWISRLTVQAGWISVAASAETGGDIKPGALYRTADGGVTWDSAATPIGAPVTMVDPAVGWLAGGPPRLRHLMATADGGRTWIERTIPLPVAEQADEIVFSPPKFFGPEDGVLPVLLFRPPAPDGRQDILAFFYFTTSGGQASGGRDWQTRTAVTRDGKIVGSGLPEMVTMNEWLMVQPDSSIVATTDSGETWSTTSASHTIGAVMMASFRSASVGWVVVIDRGSAGLGSGTDGRLLATTDGGATWEGLAPQIR